MSFSSAQEQNLSRSQHKTELSSGTLSTVSLILSVIHLVWPGKVNGGVIILREHYCVHCSGTKKQWRAVASVASTLIIVKLQGKGYILRSQCRWKISGVL